MAHRHACSQSPSEQAKSLPGAVASPAYYRIHSADGHRQPLLLERDPVHQAVFHRVALLVLVTQQIASYEITRARIKLQTARGVLVAQQVRCLSLDRKPFDVRPHEADAAALQPGVRDRQDFLRLRPADRLSEKPTVAKNRRKILTGKNFFEHQIIVLACRTQARVVSAY